MSLIFIRAIPIDIPVDHLLFKGGNCTNGTRGEVCQDFKFKHLLPWFLALYWLERPAHLNSY